MITPARLVNAFPFGVGTLIPYRIFAFFLPLLRLVAFAKKSRLEGGLIALLDSVSILGSPRDGGPPRQDLQPIVAVG